jgi:hypothetical protein
LLIGIEYTIGAFLDQPLAPIWSEGASCPRRRTGEFSSTQIVIGLLVAVGFDGLGLVIGIEDHIGKSTDITIIAPPSGSEHRIKAIGTLARWRFAFESGFEPGSRTRQRR